MAMIWVNGIECPTPSDFKWGMIDISGSDSGRTLDSEMHKNRIAQKRQIQLVWNGPDVEKTAKILQMFNPEYVQVTYPDAMSGKNETRTFYVGDRSAPVSTWFVGNQRFTNVSFNIIER